MPRVTSADGTEIAYERRGRGPPVVCLHGTGVTRRVWRGLADRVDDAALVLVDRRGRGESGDAADWSLEHELQDVTAVVEAEAPGGVTLFGSSFGGLLAVRAAERLDLEGLVVYEPPMPAVTVDRVSADPAEVTGFADEIDRRIRQGDREAAVRFFFEETTGADDVERWPIWPDCVELAETIARECHVVEAFRPGDLDVSAPALLFKGSDSPPYLRAGIDVLDDLLPDTRVVEVPAAHAGVGTAPDAIAPALRSFLHE